MDTPVSTVGDRLCVGQIPTNFTSKTQLFPGLATINGPLCCGAVSGDVPIANAIFGPGFNPAVPVSLASIGITNIFGSFNTYALTNVAGITNIFGLTTKNAVSAKNGVCLKNALNLGNGASVFNGILTANGGIIVPPSSGIEAGGISADIASFKEAFIADLTAPGKKFNIPHPSKPGYRLVHGCLEGPEFGVYHRGRLSNTNKIILPDYWTNLINPETITVHLTPRKFHQELYVKSIEWGKVINIINNSGGPIDCDYIVHAERIDISKLIVEVEDEN